MIFKVEKRRFRQNGVLRLTRYYHLRYRFGEMAVDRWKSLGVTDKQVAEKRAQEFIQEKEREAAGILEPKVIRTAAMRPLAAHLARVLVGFGKAESCRAQWQRGATTQDARHYVNERVQLERGFQCQRGFVYCVEKPSKKLGSDVKPLSASNGFIPKLDGTSWTNQRQSVEICGEN